MQINTVELVGFIAGTLSTCSFLPQVIKVWKTKSTRDISLTTFIFYCAAMLMWLTYGILSGSKPIIVTNSIVSVLSFIILFFKLKYK